MKDQKLNQLFAAARLAASPPPPPDFAAAVLRAVRGEPPVRPVRTASLFDQLNYLFPRAAVAALALIALCVAVDFGLASAGLPELGDGAAQLTTQLVFDVDDL